MDITRKSWNSHLICPSKNEYVPCGRPDVMHTVPELYGTEDYLCDVPEQEIVRCQQNCVSRSDIACDKDVHTLCTSIMAQNNLTVPTDAYVAIDLYIELREKLVRLLDN